MSISDRVAGDVAAARHRLADRSVNLLRDQFGVEPDGVWFAPGRVNLIGEHTDYNEGFVLPFALGHGVAVAAARRDDGVLALRSRQAPDAPAVLPIADLAPGAAKDAVPGWAAYPAGVAWALRESGHPVVGASIAVDSDLPVGAGLSSSAALECATVLALVALAGTGSPLRSAPLSGVAPPPGGAGTWRDDPDATAEWEVSRAALAEIARRAENEFVGVPSGIMDQSAALLCRAGHALLLDCRSREATQIPFAPAATGVQVLVVNTRARHELTGGEYADRRAQCEQAARRLGVAALRDVGDAADTERLDDPVLRRRARHVITDNERVRTTVALLRAWADGDRSAADRVGGLLTRSHRSLRDDFEVSWPEADAAVDAAVTAGALGARMIGGGFGGSVLALVPAAAVEGVVAAVSRSFAEHGWPSPGFLDAVPADGAQRLL